MLDKAYEPKPVEDRWRKLWREKKAFHWEAGEGRDPFVIVIPPPNVTGALHIGHALNNTLQDVFVRYHRLAGRAACWVPGTDHGGIATQNVMEKQLKAEGGSRHALGREAFLERMKEWTRQCKSTILGQLERLGCALDWERESFTMDEQRAKSVFAAFKQLWEKGLIYRGERMVNWCVRCGTALSDSEVEHEERKGSLWHIDYGQGIVVATTRPETMFGDTAVGVNPKDDRYKKLVGKKVRLPLTERDIPVIADDYIEAGFGSGALKVTPAHDVNDFELGLRHNLPVVKVIAPDGKLQNAPGYDGLSREQARDKVVADLKEKGLIVKVEDHKNSVGCCYRCGSVIEPLLSLQWFVKMKPLAELALKAHDAGEFKLHPENWGNSYKKWLHDLRDWCVSRQIWWGHRIPVWYKDGQEPKVSLESPGAGWTQDPDVLDTWFSSALWPFSVFGWPEQTKDLKFFYPTSVLITGYEILYLWVARMQMFGLQFLGKAPFSDALIHGIVRDKTGKKMSKSLGNVIDPLLMMDKYGTDAFRFSLLVQAHPGRDIPFAEESVTGSRNFANKLWNSTRFVMMYLPENPSKPYKMADLSHCCLELSDKWILAEYQAVIAEVRAKLEAWQPAAAADAIYGFLWDKFCAWYVELAKIRLQGIESDEKEAARAILVHVLTGTLKLLHPFMPFITEEVYAALKPYSGEKAEGILDSGLPNLEYDWSNDEAVAQMRGVMELVTSLRSLRSQLNVSPAVKITVHGETAQEGYVKQLAGVEAFVKNGSRPAQSATAVAGGKTFYVPLAGLIDFAKERARLEKEAQKAEAEVAKIAQKAANPNFVARAPKEEVELAKQQHTAAEQRLARLKETLAVLS
jgi:valyl-tRNA synthetase